MVPLGKDCEKSFTLCDKIKGSEMVCAHPPTSSTTVAPAPTECSQCGAPITSTLPASSSRPLHHPPQDNPNGAGSPTSKYSLRCGCGPPLSHHFSQWTPTAHRASGPMISSERAHCDAPRCRRTAIAKVPHEPSRCADQVRCCPNAAGTGSQSRSCCCSCSFSLSRWTAAISDTQAIATRGPQCTCWSWALPEEWLLPCRSSKAWARLWVSWACRSSCTAGWQAGRPAFTLPCLMGGTNLLPRAWLSCWGV